MVTLATLSAKRLIEVVKSIEHYIYVYIVRIYIDIYNIYIYIHPEEVGGSIGFFSSHKNTWQGTSMGFAMVMVRRGVRYGQPSSWRNPKSSDGMAVEIPKNVNDFL